jgi:DNA primase
VLCFDGDGAGQRAAYRAVDLALPKLAPGKSLRFASLPEGQDPDDLARSGGPSAIAEVLAAARPLADVLWARETETGRFDTPERRAGLDMRIKEVTAVIAHESVRKYYRQDLENRLRNFLSPPRAAPAQQGYRGAFRSERRQGAGSGFGGRRGPSDLPTVREAFAPLSPRLSTSPLVRGSRSALPPREALILLAILNHPWLIEAHAEEISELEFLHPGADQLRRTILDAGAAHHDRDPAALRAFIAAGNLGAVVVRLEAAITHLSDWPARPGAAPEDVRPWWTHIVTLHRKARTLHKELRDAERALGDEPSEKNFGWLRDIRGRLSALEGTEASIEGFGALSGRPVRSF